MVALPILTSVLCVHVCVSSTAMLQWPEKENHQPGGLCQVVQQTVLLGSYWDLHGEWQMSVHQVLIYSDIRLQKQTNGTQNILIMPKVSMKNIKNACPVHIIGKLLIKSTLIMKYTWKWMGGGIFIHSLYSVVPVEWIFISETYFYLYSANS